MWQSVGDLSGQCAFVNLERLMIFGSGSATFPRCGPAGLRVLAVDDSPVSDLTPLSA
jgi:hypothetical protein